MKTTKSARKTVIKTNDAKTSKARVEEPFVSQEERCAEVIADLHELCAGVNDIDSEDFERILKERGVTKDFIQEVLDNQSIEKEKLKQQALDGLRRAYKRLPVHLKRILDNMESADMCDAICGVDEDE